MAEGGSMGEGQVQRVGGAGMGNLFCSFVSRLHQNEVKLVNLAISCQLQVHSTTEIII